MLGLILVVFFVATFWLIYKKANQPAWACLIPIYNLIVFMWIIKRPAILLLLLLIPIVNIIFAIIFLNGLSKSFNQGAGFTVGLIFLPFIFFPLLAFGKSYQYIYSNKGSNNSNSSNYSNFNSSNDSVEYK
jgi:hypothetical protein